MIDGRRVLAVITARGGSKGLPRKNVLALAGKPLIAWSIDAALGARSVDQCIVSTDDDEIAEVSRRYGALVPFKREAALASDTASSMDVLFDALRRVPGFDIVVLLQPTSPLRTRDHVEAGLVRLCESGADSCLSLAPARDHPWLTYRIDANHSPVSFCAPDVVPRRQDMPEAWVLNGAFYASRVEGLEQRRSFMTGRVTALEMTPDESVDIDGPGDFQEAERLMQLRLES
jgi:CMP-N,N'-diacetyllegionaminic acid synthase